MSRRLRPWTLPSGVAAVGLLFGTHAGAQDDALLLAPPAMGLADAFGAMASADLDRDGVADLVLAGAGTSGASVFLGSPDLTLSLIGTLPLSANLEVVSLVDLNGDDKPDLVALHSGTTVTVRLGLGDGTFTASQDHLVGDDPTDVACGDLNGDGLVDLVVSNYGTSDVSILAGIGGGDFAPATSQAVGLLPQSVSLGDVDEDGRLDLAAATFTGVYVLPGNGDGTFSPAGGAVFTGFTRDVLLHDLNADGHLDVIADPQSWLLVAAGDGAGAFGPAQVLSSSFVAAQLLPHDADGDGLADVLAVDSFFSRVAVVPAKSGGLPDALRYLPADPGASLAVPLDLSDDPVSEIAVLDYAHSRLSLLLGLQGPAVASRQIFDLNGYLRSLAVGDLDDDGQQDILLGWIGVPVSGPNGLAVLLGLGDGLFTPGQVINNPPTTSIARRLALGDIDGDGVLDMAQVRGAMNQPSGGEVSIRLGLGNLAFAPTVVLLGSGDVSDLVLADVDLDGAADLVLGNHPLVGSITVLWGDGTGQFPTTDTFSAGASAVALAVGDIDRDGLQDLAAAAAATATQAALVLFASAPRDFGAPQMLAAGFGPGRDVALADLDSDEFLDVVVGVETGFVLVPCPGGSPATPAPTLGVTPDLSTLEVGDIGGDGVPDVALVWSGGFPPAGQVTFACGRGDGTFLPPMTGLTANGATHIGLGAFDPSGGLGIVAMATTVPYQLNQLVVLYNGQEPTWTHLEGALSGSAGVPLLRGDGEPQGGSVVTLSLTRARPTALAALVIGLSTLHAPFKGGVMVPDLDVLITGLVTNGSGSLVLSATWPPGLPPAFTAYYQYWIADPAGPAGFAASNALSGTTP